MLLKSSMSWALLVVCCLIRHNLEHVSIANGKAAIPICGLRGPAACLLLLGHAMTPTVAVLAHTLLRGMLP